MRRPLAVTAVLVTAVLVTAGCARSRSEQAALDLAARALDGRLSSYDLEFRREIEGGYVWRVAPRPVGSAGDLPRATHLGVIVCAADERATEAVRFSFLHWQPERCEDGRARLLRVRITPAHDAERLGSFISPPRGIEDDPQVRRVSG